MDGQLSTALERATAALQQLERDLRSRHGACRIDVSLVEAGDAVEVRGEVLVDRLRARVCSVVQEHVPPGVAVVEALRVVQGGPWFELLGVTTVRSSAEGGGDVTILHPHDGPVERLAEHGQAWLVRDRCGTAGWVTAGLGREVQAPMLARPRSRGPSDFVHAARTFVGTPYRLGGTDRDAIDCSGLVQRAAWQALGIAVPRNTGDLWSLGARAGRPPSGLGHLVFVWARGESLRHVGIVASDAVVHASLSRRVVVADPMARFYAEVARVDHLPFEALVALGERAVGHPNLLAAGLRLGAAPQA